MLIGPYFNRCATRRDHPPETISNRYDFVYYFEAVDNAGNAAIYPDWEVENPYVMVRVGE